MNQIDYRLLSEFDAERIMQYLVSPFFDCGNADDSWDYEEIKAWLSNSNDYCIGAFLKEEVVGFCLTHFHQEVHKVHLENIYVVEKYRGTDVAKNILERVITRYLQDNKKVRFIGLVDENNIRAINFLKKEKVNFGNKMIWVQVNYDY